MNATPKPRQRIRPTTDEHALAMKTADDTIAMLRAGLEDARASAGRSYFFGFLFGLTGGASRS